MKKLFAVLMAIILVASYVYAGDDIIPAAKTGATSLNFTFGGLGAFDFGGVGPSVPVPDQSGNTSSTPAGISLSFFMSNSAALRIGLQVQYDSKTIPSNLTNGTDGSGSLFAAGLSLDYIGYMASSNSRVRPYLGGGLLFTYSSNDEKDPHASGETQYERKDYQPAGIGAEVVGIVGAEFFIYNEISVSAEYQLNVFGIQSFSDTKTTSGSTTITTKNGSLTEILGFGALGATVHIYF